MARRVLLHIGAPKSGTTYVQSRLHRNAATLARHGVLVPLGEQGDRPHQLVFRAALDLTGIRLNHPRRFTDGYWDRLVAAVASYAGTAVVSHEAFVRADEAAVARGVAALAAGGTDLHVVYTVRDLARSLVSGWLEGLKHGGTATLDAHLRRARERTLPLRAAFDAPALLGRWLAHVPAERMHVVTVPQASGDPELLWHRFLSVGGLDPAWAPAAARARNPSVGVPEAQVLRALNVELGGRSQRGKPLHPLVRDVVAGALAGRPSPRVELPPAHRGWVEDDVAATKDWLAGSSVRVVGDLGDLNPRPVDPATYVDPDVAHPAATEAAVAALAAVVVEAGTPRVSP